MNEDYKKYLEQKFIGLSGQIKSQNDLQDIRLNQMLETLNEVLQHVKITNGRVNKLENTQITCPRDQVIQNTKELTEVKFIRKYFKTLATGVLFTILTAIIATLKSFGVF